MSQLLYSSGDTKLDPVLNLFRAIFTGGCLVLSPTLSVLVPLSLDVPEYSLIVPLAVFSRQYALSML